MKYAPCSHGGQSLSTPATVLSHRSRVRHQTNVFTVFQPEACGRLVGMAFVDASREKIAYREERMGEVEMSEAVGDGR